MAALKDTVVRVVTGVKEQLQCQATIDVVDRYADDLCGYAYGWMRIPNKRTHRPLVPLKEFGAREEKRGQSFSCTASDTVDRGPFDVWSHRAVLAVPS